ncbi:claudin-10-like [Micropterus salmoides]|uniref:claudin-10-like n=1 Tax=Micropterus salmoides TaxID=27706 RepID=UPI0018EC51DA|nr:claudin-10-like [Micropterus salmoides]
MKGRTAVMYIEIGCFVSCLSGWILVCSTLPTDYWTYSQSSTTVLTTAKHYSNLWKDCVSDRSGVSDCKVFPSLLALSVFLHACRALAICAVITGFFGGVLTLIGMKCTKIGGSELANARVTFAGSITYLVSGFCGMITYSWWANRVITEFLDPQFVAQKYELGAAVFIGWGGSILLLSGGTVLAYFSGREGLTSSSVGTPPKRPQSQATQATAWNRRGYMPPAPSSRVTLVPSLFYDGRKSRATRATLETFSRDSFV